MKEAAAGLLSGIFVMAVRNVLLFRGAVNILDFFSQCGDLLGMLTALGDLQQGYGVK